MYAIYTYMYINSFNGKQTFGSSLRWLILDRFVDNFLCTVAALVKTGDGSHQELTAFQAL